MQSVLCQAFFFNFAFNKQFRFYRNLISFKKSHFGDRAERKRSNIYSDSV